MSSYATVTDVQSRIMRDLTTDEQAIVTTLLADAGVIIDAYNADASTDVKLIVSCNMVIRAIGDGSDSIPVGATQGSMSALGYTQSWTISGGGSVGDMYLTKKEKFLLGCGNKVGSYSPVEELVRTTE